MRTALDALVTERSLAFVSGGASSDWAQLMSASALEAAGIKNVCARVSSDLAGEIDQVVGLLGISKRRFLEAAMLDAVEKAKSVMRAEGVFDELHRERAERAPVVTLQFDEAKS